MTRPRLPSRTAFEQAAAYVRELGYDDRGFSLSPDGTVTVLPANRPGASSDYDKWKRAQQ